MTVPNIELHGFDKRDQHPLNWLRPVFHDAPYAPTITVVWSDTSARALDGTNTPFIRVSATEKYDVIVPDIVERLKPLGYDIEVTRLEKYIPKS